MSIKSIEYKGYHIEILREEYPLNPREEYDTLGVMVCFHDRYRFGDKHDIPHRDYAGLNDVKAHLTSKYEIAVILPVYMYDHSGITISHEPFSCPWDSWQIGFIYATKEVVRNRFGHKRITKQLIEQTRSALLGEIRLYDDYLTGNCYRYYIRNNAGEVVESLGGFYGSDGDFDDLITTAKGDINHLVQQVMIEKQKRLKTFIQSKVPLDKRRELLSTS